MVCFNCSDKGLINGCPVCQREYRLVKYVAEFPDTKIQEQVFKIIPESYRVDWDTEKLKTKYLEYKDDTSFIAYTDMLEQLVDVFRRGKLPKQSALILSSAGLGKTHLAYCCMMLAASFGFKIAPLIDTTQYRRLNNISMDPVMFRSYIRDNSDLPTIESILLSDIQFIYVDPTCFKDAHRDIMSIVSKRDRYGKPTIILSCNTINQIAYTDYEKDFKSFLTNKDFSKEKQLRVLSMFMR